MHLKFGCESYVTNNLFFSWKKKNKQVEDCIRMLKCHKFLFKRNKELGFTFWWPEAARTLEVVSCLFCQHSLFFHGDEEDDKLESFGLKRAEMVGVSWILDLFTMWHNFPVWAMSIACLVRPLSYIFYLFRDTLLAYIWHAQPNTSNYSTWLGMPPFQKSAVFLNIVQKAFGPPPPHLFEHLSYFAGGVF